MKVLLIGAYTVVDDASSVPTHDSMAKTEKTNDGHGLASTDRLDLEQRQSTSDDSMTASDNFVNPSIDASDIVGPLNNASSTDNDTIFHTSYTEARQLHGKMQYEEALAKYRVALQCKHRTILSEPQPIQEKFCSTLYYIGKLHYEAGIDDTMRGIEAMYFCLHVRRSCFGSTHPSVATVLLEMASMHEEYSEYQYALDLLLEALAILLPDTSDPGLANNRVLIHVWNSMGRAHRALGQEDEAQSSFEEAEKLK